MTRAEALAKASRQLDELIENQLDGYARRYGAEIEQHIACVLAEWKSSLIASFALAVECCTDADVSRVCFLISTDTYVAKTSAC